MMIRKKYGSSGKDEEGGIIIQSLMLLLLSPKIEDCNVADTQQSAKY